MSAARIIIDTDPGIDDAVALMVADGMRGALDLVGVTAVAGNTPLETTYPNARALMHLLDRSDVPVLRGCARPILRSAYQDAGHIHGENGLGGVLLNDPEHAHRADHAVDYIIAMCLAAKDDPLVLCPIGPLTNIALALIKAPEIAVGIDRIVLMGGAAFIDGNVTPAAEFNIWADPHAAEVVFRAPVKKVMIGLDVTLDVGASDAWLSEIETIGPLAGTAAQMLSAYQSRNRALHDPCVPVYVARPDMFDGVRCNVSVDLEEGARIGKTTATLDEAGDTIVLTGVDPDGVRAMIAEGLNRR